MYIYVAGIIQSIVRAYLCTYAIWLAVVIRGKSQKPKCDYTLLAVCHRIVVMVLSYLHQNRNEQRFQERHAGANDQQSLPGLETLLRNVPPATHHNTLLVRL
jgi:hypothetical protein